MIHTYPVTPPLTHTFSSLLPPPLPHSPNTGSHFTVNLSTIRLVNIRTLIMILIFPVSLILLWSSCLFLLLPVCLFVSWLKTHIRTMCKCDLGSLMWWFFILSSCIYECVLTFPALFSRICCVYGTSLFALMVECLTFVWCVCLLLSLSQHIHTLVTYWPNSLVTWWNGR